jgi:hypothetical protein
MKVSTENDNNFGYEKITIVVDNIPLTVALSKRSFVLSGHFFVVLNDDSLTQV